jgi:hypothetical protein
MPNNGNYMIAAYVVAAVILLGFAGRLWSESGRRGQWRRDNGEGKKEREE